MKFGALTLLLSTVSLIATITLLFYVIFADARTFAYGALGCSVLTFVLFVVYKIFSSSAHCPLCRGPVLAGSGAQRNRNAKRTLGSHRLRVARNIIFTNTFHCPYCNEPTRCVIKERPKSSQVVKRRSAHRNSDY